MHSVEDEVEIPGVVYVSEISHNLDDKCYCYGCEHYIMSKMKEAFVGILAVMLEE